TYGCHSVAWAGVGRAPDRSSICRPDSRCGPLFTHALDEARWPALYLPAYWPASSLSLLRVLTVSTRLCHSSRHHRYCVLRRHGVPPIRAAAAEEGAHAGRRGGPLSGSVSGSCETGVGDSG